MIRKTLQRTAAATFAVLAPSKVPAHQGFPLPVGTGFFIDPGGYFLTARHVIEEVVAKDIWLEKELGVEGFVQWPELVEDWPDVDLALLKADWKKNSDKAFLQGSSGFPYLEVDLEPQMEGTPVYSFGYPLPDVEAPKQIGEGVMVGHVGLGRRTTSAIIASTLYMTKMIQEVGGQPVEYVFDKALNYGNSGGPIILEETGHAFAVCQRFQPVVIPQGNRDPILIPSLYGVGISISVIADRLRALLSYL